MKTKIFIGLLLMTLAGLLLQSQVYRLRSTKMIPPGIKQTLQVLAEQALAEREVPIGAVLVYGDSIIGTGYNTVVRDTNLAAHAEINAMKAAHRKYLSSWRVLDRHKMVIYSTYEPCDMCKGAMLNLGITHAVFEGRKPGREQVAGTLKSWWYECQKEQYLAPGMQDSLFHRHPDFPGK